MASAGFAACMGGKLLTEILSLSVHLFLTLATPETVLQVSLV